MEGIELNSYDLLKQILTPCQIAGLTKVRIGNKSDGGYIVAKELLEREKFVLSYGVGNTPEAVSFDLHLASEGYTIFMFDGTIKRLPLHHSNFVFINENVASNNIERHLTQCNIKNSNLVTAKIDIEGCEYELFENCNSKVFDQCCQLIVEFHDLLPINFPGYVSLIPFKEDMPRKIKILKRILISYEIFHLHGNNFSYSNLDIPNVIEITFVRKDLIKRKKIESIPYPIINLDFPCNAKREDLILQWWCKNPGLRGAEK
jgi:hypothetical protein